MAISDQSLSLFAILTSALLSAGMTWAFRPLLLKFALAKPNARSSHHVPTPQGAGIAVIGATLVVAGAIISYAGEAGTNFPLAVFSASMFLAIVGFVDDIKPLPVLMRLMLQAMAVGAIIFTAPNDLRIISAFPAWLERGLVFFAGLWFVNLVNFMDGLDWMTVAEVVPVTSAIVILGWLGAIPASTTIMAASLCGAMVGFAPFNRPMATVFLGDVGSLPIGLLLGWCLWQLSGHQQYIAALLLPLYYVSDATVTLMRRITRHEPFWAAHRSHYYQRATDNGFAVFRVVGEVFVLNLGLAALAIVSTLTSLAAPRILCLFLGGLATASLIYRFARRRPPP